MEVSWSFGYRTKIFMKAMDGNLHGDLMTIQAARMSMEKESWQPGRKRVYGIN
jgi:hypothetical protein